MSRGDVEHEPVLCGPLISTVAPRPGEIVVDATVGHGGHARLMAEAIGPTGQLIGLDVDASNLARAQRRFEEAGLADRGPHIDLIRANFSELQEILDSLGVGGANVILADLGVSTDQLLDPDLGLTFTEDGPLDMRLDDRLTTTAADLINSLPEKQLADLIFSHAQERFSRRIARHICRARRAGRIRTTRELARIVCSALGVRESSRPGKRHPATRTFLALRIAVNRECDHLQALLSAAPERLLPGGRIAVISFHSGEDRLVKRDFLDRQRRGVYEVNTIKPIRPSSEEVRLNARSRSAKLRVATRRAEVQDAA